MSARFTDAARALLLIFAAFAVGQAIHIRDGEYDGRAIRWVGVALAVTLAAVLLPRLPSGETAARRISITTVITLAIAVGVFFLQLLMSPASGWNEWSDDLVRNEDRNLLLYRIGLGFAAAVVVVLFVHGQRWWVQAIAILAIGPIVGFAAEAGMKLTPTSQIEPPTPEAIRAFIFFNSLYTTAAAALLVVLTRRGRWPIGFALLLVLHFGLGAWIIRSSAEPKIDVFVFQQLGARALLAGDNPYAVTYPDIYANTAKAEDRSVYGKGLSRDGQLSFGFPYPPLSLLLSTAGYLFGGDYRYAQAAALTLAGLFLALACPGRWSALAAILLLFTPREFFILGRGWTEPLVVMLLAATLFAASRFPRWLFLALGVFLASKQYLVFAVPLAWLLIPDWRDWRAAVRLIGGALLVAAVVSLPLALWDFKAFWHSTVTVQQVAPFREDALSWLVWYARKLPPEAPRPEAWIAFAVAGPMLVLSLLLCPRTPSGFALGLSAVYLPFIALNKQAFANYYLFVIGALVCALATLHVAPVRPVEVELEDPAA